MRVVLASVIGLCCTFHSVWAVEVATVQTTPNSVAAAAVQAAVAPPLLRQNLQSSLWLQQHLKPFRQLEISH